MTDAEHHARRVLATRSDGVCETCGRRRATDYHHRQNRSQGGTWSPAAALHLCRRCHHTVTTHPEAAYRHGWLVYRGDDPAQVPVLLATEFGEIAVLLRDDGGIAAAD